MKWILLVIFCFSITSCQVDENVVISQENQKKTVVKIYNQDGLSFLYPNKWTIKHDEIIRELGRVIAIQDGKDSLFVISLFPSEVNLSLEEYAKNVETEWKTRVKNGKDLKFNISEIERNISLEQSKGIRLKFLFENILYTQDLFLVKGKKKIAVFAIQTADENLENANKDFQLIFDSLKIELER